MVAAADTLETAHRAETATLFWVAAPMALLAMDASQDIPTINGADAPATTGLMVMAEPLPAWDTSAIGGLALRDGPRTDIRVQDAPLTTRTHVWAWRHQ